MSYHYFFPLMDSPLFPIDLSALTQNYILKIQKILMFCVTSKISYYHPPVLWTLLKQICSTQTRGQFFHVKVLQITQTWIEQLFCKQREKDLSAHSRMYKCSLTHSFYFRLNMGCNHFFKMVFHSSQIV